MTFFPQIHHGQHLGILVIELGVGITVAAVMISIFRAYAGEQKPLIKRTGKDGRRFNQSL